MARQPKILIVEDDPDTSDMLLAYFEDQGYEVLTVAWGNDALKLCQKTVPDLIVQDIRLPDIDGYEVVRELRRNLRTSNVPIIFLTEKTDRKDKMAGLKLGAVDYITKPFDMLELRLRVQNALRRAKYASLVSPVTGLPGKEVTEERLKDLLDENRWAVVCVSLVDIDRFGEVYGFVAGDDVLRAVGLIVSNVLDETGGLEDFVGHISKADFVLVTREDKVHDIQSKLATRLRRAFDYFYPIKDIESGQVSAPMKAELGIVTSSSGSFDSPGAIFDAIVQTRQTVASSYPSNT